MFNGNKMLQFNELINLQCNCLCGSQVPYQNLNIMRQEQLLAKPALLRKQLETRINILFLKTAKQIKDDIKLQKELVKQNKILT